MVLVTPEEAAQAQAQRVRKAKAPPPSTAPQLGPTIRVTAPAMDAPLPAPFPVEVVFAPAPDGAPIAPASFRVRYGWMRLDVTDRILREVQPHAIGLRVDAATVPPGEHEREPSIADESGRRGSTQLTIRVK